MYRDNLLLARKLAIAVVPNVGGFNLHDLVIRAGRVVDGTGSVEFTADIAVTDGVIVEVGEVEDRGKREVDADGLLATPGWVDIHTHYDGQATWDADLTPSTWHGVTTAIFGNCAVGFAPVKQEQKSFLINLMEGVEDIPGSVLAEGVSFDWESFPEYLDALERLPRTTDVGAQVPHAALRFYVMGTRGADPAESPSDFELAEMGRLLEEALLAGAIGLSTSRTVKHRTKDGKPTPSLSADVPEMCALAEAMGRAGRGVIQANSDFNSRSEFELLRTMGAISGQPVSFTLLQVNHAPERWRELLLGLEEANSAGIQMRGQVGSRAIGVLIGLQATVNPWVDHATFKEIAHLPISEIVACLRKPETKRAMLAEAPSSGIGALAAGLLKDAYALEEPINYEPDPSTSISARAAALDVPLLDLVYDLLLQHDGHSLLYNPFENYSYGNLDPVREMMLSPYTISGLSDGGAHVGTVCDASFPTYLLTHWARDRSRGARLPLEHVVQRQTRDTARAIGLRDRGTLEAGMRADINIIDFENLAIHRPTIVHDLPAGGKRIVQRAAGYRHTFVAGEETYRDGEATGATPGRVIRIRG